MQRAREVARADAAIRLSEANRLELKRREEEITTRHAPKSNATRLRWP